MLWQKQGRSWFSAREWIGWRTVPGEEPFQDGFRGLETQAKEENVIQERLHRQWHTQKTVRPAGAWEKTRDRFKRQFAGWIEITYCSFESKDWQRQCKDIAKDDPVFWSSGLAHQRRGYLVLSIVHFWGELSNLPEGTGWATKTLVWDLGCGFQ